MTINLHYHSNQKEYCLHVVLLEIETVRNSRRSPGNINYEIAGDRKPVGMGFSSENIS